MDEGRVTCGGREIDRRTIARLVIRMHKLVGERLGRGLSSTPGWDMLLDLYIREEHRPMSLTSLCGASDAPPRTALNTINRLVERGLLIRAPDERDGRRVNVELSASAVRLIDACFADILEIGRKL